MVLWKVTGYVNLSGGGGIESYYVFTPDETLPDCDAILPNAGHIYGDGTARLWGWIEQIERLEPMPMVFNADDPEVTQALKVLREHDPSL
jgi:hypothetical protein